MSWCKHITTFQHLLKLMSTFHPWRWLFWISFGKFTIHGWRNVHYAWDRVTWTCHLHLIWSQSPFLTFFSLILLSPFRTSLLCSKVWFHLLLRFHISLFGSRVWCKWGAIYILCLMGYLFICVMPPNTLVLYLP